MFTAVDVGVAVLVLISAILATARGFTREVLSLATWAGSAAIAAYMYFYHNDLAKQYIKEEIVATGVTVIGTFLVALIVLHLLTMWIGDLVVDSRVGPLDRTLGFVFGAARGVLICMVCVFFAVWLLSGTTTIRAVEASCTDMAKQPPAATTSSLDKACLTYASAQTPANDTALLQACPEAMREPTDQLTGLRKACVAYVDSLGPRGEPGLPEMLSKSKSAKPLEEAAYWLVDRLPPDVESQLLTFLQKKNQPAEPPGGPTPDQPASSVEPDDASSSAPATNT